MVLSRHQILQVVQSLGQKLFNSCIEKNTLYQRQATDQVGSDTQVFPDGVLVLCGRTGLTDARPLAVNLPHRVLWNFREHRLGCIVFLQG